MSTIVLRVVALFLLLGSVPGFAQSPAPSSFEAGRDYFLIDPAQPTRDADRIEVVEVFGYSCGACAAFQPLVNAWPGKQAPDVAFRYVPAFFGGIWDELGQAFLAADAMGVVERTHDAMFASVHVERSIRGPDDIVAFYAKQGVDADAFRSTRDSFAVKAAAARTRQQLPRYGINVTPTLIVNGKYRVEAANGVPHARMLDVVDHLIARERAARAAR